MSVIVMKSVKCINFKYTQEGVCQPRVNNACPWRLAIVNPMRRLLSFIVCVQSIPLPFPFPFPSLLEYPTSIVWVKLAQVGHKRARFSVEPLKVLARQKHERFGD